MDKGEIIATITSLGVISIFISLIIMGFNEKTEVKKGTILNSTSGKYVEGYVEVNIVEEPTATILIFVMIIGGIVTITGTVALIKFG